MDFLTIFFILHLTKKGLYLCEEGGGTDEADSK
jgi:hypothetical protein